MGKNLSNYKSIRNRNLLDNIFTIILVVFSIVAFACAGILIFQKTYYEPFWVNGQSMYPTLNSELIMPSGEKAGINGSSTQAGSTNVDYGIMDTHSFTLNKLKRFDIVITHYSSLENSDDVKIKRIIGLPGETIRFDIKGAGNEGNGALSVKNDDSWTYVSQPIPNEYVEAANNYPNYEITLKDNEYYVLGDNRYPGKSNDSRDIGAITKDLIVGKAVALCAHCDIKKENGELVPTNIKHYTPRFF